jgi:tyrosinase
MHTHETMLRTECNYKGPMPWWDEAKDADAGNLYQSDMWTADHFGGNGRASDSCVVDGVFANTTEHIGPLLENTDYCYYREWSPQQMPNMTSAAVESCTKYDTYYDFFNCMVVYPDGPHVAGHVSVGGLVRFLSITPRFNAC